MNGAGVVAIIAFLIIISSVAYIIIDSPKKVHIPLPTITFQGWYKWTWSTAVNAPQGTNSTVLFSGYADVQKALSNSASVKKIPGKTYYLSVGGGNVNGRFTAATLTQFIANVGQVKTAGYAGVCFDVEEGDAGLAPLFSNAFAACVKEGLVVMVTTSHSAPFGITDASTLVNSWVKDSNIGILSPQLYTSGTETTPDVETSMGVAWSIYKDSKAKFAPSIVSANQYPDVQKFFGGQGIGTNGYFVWAQF